MRGWGEYGGDSVGGGWSPRLLPNIPLVFLIIFVSSLA